MPSGALQPRLASKPLLWRHAMEPTHTTRYGHSNRAKFRTYFIVFDPDQSVERIVPTPAQSRRASCAAPKLAHRSRGNHAINSSTTSGVHWSRSKWADALPSKGSTKGTWCSERASRMPVANLATCLESSLQRHSLERAQPIHRARQVDHARNSNNDRHGLFQSSP